MWASGVRLLTLKALGEKRPLLGLVICRDMCLHTFFWCECVLRPCPRALSIGIFFSYKRCFFYSVWISFFLSKVFYFMKSKLCILYTLWGRSRRKNILAGWSLSEIPMLCASTAGDWDFFFAFCYTLLRDIIFCSRLFSVGLYLFGNTGQTVDITNAVQDF